MTHATPRPWELDDVSEDNAGQETLGIVSEGYGYVCGIHCGPDAHIDEGDRANAELIVRAVNAHDDLIQENAAIKTALREMLEAYAPKVKQTIQEKGITSLHSAVRKAVEILNYEDLQKDLTPAKGE